MVENYTELENKNLRLKRRHVKILWSALYLTVILGCVGYYFLAKFRLINVLVYACCLSICECIIYSYISKITSHEEYKNYARYIRLKGKRLYGTK